MAFSPPSGNITTSVSFFEWINESVGSFFIAGIVIAVFFIILIKLLFGNNSAARSFGSASFVCFILAVFFRVIDLVSTGFMVIFIILTGISIIWIHVENSGATPQ